MSNKRLMPGWVEIKSKEGDTVHIAPGVTYHPNSDTPYQGGEQGAIIAVIQVQGRDALGNEEPLGSERTGTDND